MSEVSATPITKQQFPLFAKIFILVAVLALTFLYGNYKRNQLLSLTSDSRTLILKEIPQVSFSLVGSDQKVGRDELLRDTSKLLLVHYWGTWCAPCEAELPEFIKFLDSFKDKGVKALLVAVNDDDKKIKKYLKRFGKLPSNVQVLHDRKGEAMAMFGTTKVPETFLFEKSGKHLDKFVGPQDWLSRRFTDRLSFFLGN
jgi:thiol-disulfide isomerase/thioredoxin